MNEGIIRKLTTVVSLYNKRQVWKIVEKLNENEQTETCFLDAVNYLS